MVSCLDCCTGSSMWQVCSVPFAFPCSFGLLVFVADGSKDRWSDFRSNPSKMVYQQSASTINYCVRFLSPPPPFPTSHSLLPTPTSHLCPDHWMWIGLFIPPTLWQPFLTPTHLIVLWPSGKGTDPVLSSYSLAVFLCNSLSHGEQCHHSTGHFCSCPGAAW